MEKENREHKDSLFVDLFYQDETAKKNLLSLYNALHDTNYEDEWSGACFRRTSKHYQ